MFLDANGLPEDEVFETDVCVVGAGTAGITLALEFLRSDFRVCFLESGGILPDQRTQALYEGENLGYPYYPLDDARTRYWGGSSNRWHVDIGDNDLGARIRPFDEIDFVERDWVPYSGWPFDKAHLDPYYDRAQIICRVDPVSFAVEDWSDSEKTRPLNVPAEEIETVIYKFMGRRDFVDGYRETIEKGENLTTILYANVLEIDTDDLGQTVTGLQVATLEGRRFLVKAKQYILANGGLEIPRLLLLSNGVQKSGLGNQHDLVGRFFMEHLHFWSGVFLPDDESLFAEMALYNSIQRVRDVAVVGKLALPEAVQRREKLLNQNIQLIPRLIPKNFYYPLVAKNGLNSKVVNTYRKVRRKVARHVEKPVKAYYCANMSEQVPNPDSRVVLIDERDAFDQPRIGLDWQITRQDVLSIRRTQEIMSSVFEQHGLGKIFVEMQGSRPPHNTHGGYHHIGTTRMHKDPKFGVVDVNSRVHGVHNLFIAGPSVFPTGGYANPVLTLVALTVRLADHIKVLMGGE